MGASEFGSFRHLATRFFGALSPAGPVQVDDDWARGQLLPGERDLWLRMSGPDRRHAVGVARDTASLLGEETPRRDITAAALLHDVGKVESSFGTFSRVGITLAAMASGRRRLVDWAGEGGRGERGEQGERDERGHPDQPGPDRPPGLRARVSLYLTHDRVGADLLRAAGSDELTVAWAREHHQPADTWTVDRRVAQALKDADGD
jgi:hypothetical protein